ncbi:hypothetical protein [Corynebacterium endometrii]|uniref:hypothetical protein n=1 Tax=Corynebacterium endometrii TaxID=2488819 RepID=UPI00109CDB35|nr:hypothetical protein [Corynebacterium endometrii]
MSKSYDWGATNSPEPVNPPTSQFPAQGVADQSAEFETQYASANNSQPATKKSGIGKKVGIGALALALIAGAGVGGFQAYKNMQNPEPNPAGVSDEVAMDFARGDIEDCEAIPAEVFTSVGIKDYSLNAESGNCGGTVMSADGKTEAQVTVKISSGAWEAEASPVEGWSEAVLNDMPGDSSMEDVISLINDGSGYSERSQPSCLLNGTERETSAVFLEAPTCGVLYPLAHQINNLYEQNKYLTQKTDFFELKEQPTYTPVEVATLQVPKFEGFNEAFDAAPEFGTEVTSLQEQFNDSKFVVDGAEEVGDGYYCFPVTFTLGPEKDEDSDTFALPRLYVISQYGGFEHINDRAGWTSVKVGESEEYEYCGSLPVELIPGQTETKYLVVYSDFNDSGEAVFDTDGELNTIGKFTVGEPAEGESA